MLLYHKKLARQVEYFNIKFINETSGLLIYFFTWQLITFRIVFLIKYSLLNEYRINKFYLINNNVCNRVTLLLQTTSWQVSIIFIPWAIIVCYNIVKRKNDGAYIHLFTMCFFIYFFDLGCPRTVQCSIAAGHTYLTDQRNHQNLTHYVKAYRLLRRFLRGAKFIVMLI